MKDKIISLLYEEAHRRDECAKLSPPLLGYEWRRSAAMMRIAAKVVEDSWDEYFQTVAYMALLGEDAV